MGIFDKPPPDDHIPYEQYTPYQKPGRPQARRLVVVAVLIALVGAGAGFYFVVGQRPDEVERVRNVKQIKQVEQGKLVNEKLAKMDEIIVEKFVEHKIISKIDTEKNIVSIDETVWNAFDLETKEEYALRFARYCFSHGGSDEISVLITGAKSGDKLASYSEETGFREY